MISLGAWIAGTRIFAETTSDPINFVQYGVLGLVVLSFIMGWIVPKPAHEALRKDLERKEAQLDALIKTYEDKVIPVLTEVNSKIVDLAHPRGG